MANETLPQNIDKSDKVKVKYEYRVVFENPYPQNDYVHYSRAEDNVDKLPKHAPRSEETHDFVAGIQRRVVTEWSDTFRLEDLEEVAADGAV